jgi:hypothetical protein
VIAVNYKKMMQSFPIKISEDAAPQMVESWLDFNNFLHIKCMCSNFQMKKWCSHIEAIYLNARSEDGTTYDMDATYIGSTTAIQVYKAPTPLFVYTLIMDTQGKLGGGKVALVGGNVLDEDLRGEVYDNSLHRVDVLWGEVKLSSTDSLSISDKGGQETIGYIRKGVHGRRTIRRLVSEWLQAIPDMYEPKMACTSRMHKIGMSYFDIMFAPEGTSCLHGMTEPDERKREAWRTRDAFSLLDTGSCYVCQEAVLPPF